MPKLKPRSYRVRGWIAVPFDIQVPAKSKAAARDTAIASIDKTKGHQAAYLNGWTVQEPT
jgi:hypothetical protein